MSTLQRPAAPVRTTSASSFAETFNIARRRIDQLALEEEDVASPDTNCSTPPYEPDALVPSPDGDNTPGPLSPITGPITPVEDAGDVADDFAFAFDIDGVLVRGGRPIPEAIEAMRVLNGENEYGIRV